MSSVSTPVEDGRDPVDYTTSDPESEVGWKPMGLEIVPQEEKDDVQEDQVAPIDDEVLKVKEKTDAAPKLPYILLFAKFLWFGCRGNIVC